MSIVDVNSGDSGGGVPATRTINTTLPLTGGGPLSADLTLGVNDATTTTVGVVKLAANLAGTGLLPYVTGFTADTITIQNLTGLTHKGVWTTVGLRIGDNTAPTEKLEVVGNALATGNLFANSNCVLGATGGTTGLWVAPAGAPSASNFVIGGDGAGNQYLVGTSTINFGNGTVYFGRWTTAGLRVGDTTTATEKLEVVGNILATGTLYANGDCSLGGLGGGSALWVRPAGAYSLTNFVIAGDGAGNQFICGQVTLNFGNGTSFFGRWTTVGLRVGDVTTATAMLDVIGDSLLGKTDESSTTTLRGGELGTVHEVSTAYTVDSGTLTDRLLVVLASGGDVTVTLPPTSASLPPAGTKGRKIIVKRKYGSDSTVFITPDGANTIEGGTDAISLSSADDGIEPFCEVEDDGTTWQVTRIHGGQIAPP